MSERSSCIKMPTKDKNNLKCFPTSISKKTHPIKNWILTNGLTALITFISTLIPLGVGYYLSVHDFQKDVNYLKENMATLDSVNNINNNYTALNEKFDQEYKELESKLDDLDEDYHTLDKDLGIIKAMNTVYQGYATPSFQKQSFDFTTKDGVDTIQNALWTDNDVICNTEGENFNVEELVDQKLLLSYLQDGQEVYFYGQFSKNKRWDGDCIINIYKDNKLQFVTEASYNDGKLISYQQIFIYQTFTSDNVWCISKRDVTEDGNIGDSWNYFKDSDIEKDFTMENVEIDNIYNVAQVKKIIKEELNCQIEAFYHGKTVNGLYNDVRANKDENKKEESYLVKFSKEDGTVRTLYFGDFKDGKLDDQSGYAWMVGRDITKINSTYSFYIGKFNNNKPSETWTEDNSEINLSLDEINKKIRFKFIKPVLKWHGFDAV